MNHEENQLTLSSYISSFIATVYAAIWSSLAPRRESDLTRGANFFCSIFFHQSQAVNINIL
jgi:hypothetical protein